MLFAAPMVLACFRPASDVGATWCFEVGPAHNCSSIYQTMRSSHFQLCKYDEETGNATHAIDV